MPRQSATALSCVANLANTIVGAGILGLPYAFVQCGFALGVGMLVACAVGCMTSLHLLAESARTVGASDETPASFYTVAMASIPSFAFLIDLAVATKCFGVATSYLIVAADMLPSAMQELGAPPAWQSRQLWVCIAIAIAGPLACVSRLDMLRFTSSLSLCLVAYLAALALYTLLLQPPLPPCRGAVEPIALEGCHGEVSGWPSAGVVRVLTIFIFGYTCQQNLFAVVNELDTPTSGRLNGVIGCAVGIAIALYATVAVCGYHVYGSSVAPDILRTFPTDSVLFLLARVGLAVNVVLSYPLQCHPSRVCALTLWRSAERALRAPCMAVALRCGCIQPETARAVDASFDTLISEGDKRAREVPHAPPQRGPPPPFSTRYWVYTAAFVLGSWLVALCVRDLGKVMAMVGATGSTSVSYILPGAIYWRLHPQPHAKRYVAQGMLLLGVLIVPLALHAILFETSR